MWDRESEEELVLMLWEQKLCLRIFEIVSRPSIFDWRGDLVCIVYLPLRADVAICHCASRPRVSCPLLLFSSPSVFVVLCTPRAARPGSAQVRRWIHR